MQKKADLHVHSIFSERPSAWFMQKLDAGESYTDPVQAYEKAKERGMDYVTITDHNEIEGSLILKELYPGDTFTGVESTVAFPEDGQQVHLLIYGLTEDDFSQVQKLRQDIYALRDFLLERRLAHSLAHATFSVNHSITMKHLEKLILLFDVFESINGGRSRIHNVTWTEVLKSLTPEKIEELYGRHHIEPAGPKPWIKGFTGGSDDHAGIFMGTSYTLVEAQDVESFLEGIRERNSWAEGRHNDFQSLAFSVYKVAYDFSLSRGDEISPSPWIRATQMIFEKKPLSRIDRLKLRALKILRPKIRRGTWGVILELLERLHRKIHLPVEDKVDVVYDHVARLTDAHAATVAESIEKDLIRGDIVSLVQKVSAVIPGVLLVVPFLTTLRHMYHGRQLLGELRRVFIGKAPAEPKRTLWFVDSLDGDDSSPQTLKGLGWLAGLPDRQVRIVTSLHGDTPRDDLPQNLQNVPYAYKLVPLGPQQYRLKIPSVLRSLHDIYDFEPEEVYLNTPGPVGLLGLLVARLLSARSIAIYEPAFAQDLLSMAGGEAVAHLVDGYVRWFYSAADEVRTPEDNQRDIFKEQPRPLRGRTSLRGRHSRKDALEDILRPAE